LINNPNQNQASILHSAALTGRASRVPSSGCARERRLRTKLLLNNPPSLSARHFLPTFAYQKPPHTPFFRQPPCANAHQIPLKSLDNPDSAQALVKSTNLLSFCTCIHRFNGRTVTSTDEPCRASGVGRRNGWWNEQPMRIGKSPSAQPEGETWSESSRGIAGRVRRCKSRCKPKVV